MRYKIFIPIFFVALFFLAGGAVMLLWNAILPEVTSARPVTYWQAMGLLVLSRILFGGFRSPGRGKYSFRDGQQKRREHWMNLPEEDRQRMREQWRERCKK